MISCADDCWALCMYSAAVNRKSSFCRLPLWMMTVYIGKAVFLCQGTRSVDLAGFHDDLWVSRQRNNCSPNKQWGLHPLFERLVFALGHDHLGCNAIRAERNHRNVMGL